MPSITTHADFEALVRRTGITLTAQQVTDIHQGWLLMAPQLDRLRAHDRDRSAEPGHIFRPDVFGTDEGGKL